MSLSVVTFSIGFFGYLLFFATSYGSSKQNPNASIYRLGSGEFFDGIASMYDATNRIMTFGVDMSWREKLIDLLDINNTNSKDTQLKKV